MSRQWFSCFVGSLGQRPNLPLLLEVIRAWSYLSVGGESQEVQSPSKCHSGGPRVCVNAPPPPQCGVALRPGSNGCSVQRRVREKYGYKDVFNYHGRLPACPSTHYRVVWVHYLVLCHGIILGDTIDDSSSGIIVSFHSTAFLVDWNLLNILLKYILKKFMLCLIGFAFTELPYG